MARPARRRIAIALAWLLTPILAWAAAFFSGWMATLTAGLFESPGAALVATAVASLLGAVAATVAWVRFLGRITKRQTDGAAGDADTTSG